MQPASGDRDHRALVSRRGLLRQTLVLAAAGAGASLLAACGGAAATQESSTPAPPVVTTSTRAATAPTSAATSRARGNASGAPAASSAPAAKGTALEVASYLKTEPQKDAYIRLFGAYAKVKPEVTLSQQLIPGTLADYTSKVTAQLAAGTPPDLMETIWGLSQSLGTKGVLLSLDPLLERAKISTADYVQDALELGRWPQRTGSYFAWYTMFSVSPLFYNTRLFQDAGEAPPDDTWTYQHLVDVAQKLTKTSGSPQQQVYGFQLTYFMETLLYSFGWAYTTPDFSQCLLGSPQSLAALQFWQDLTYKYAVSPTPGGDFAKGAPYGPFSTNRLAMSIHASYQVEPYRTVKGLDWDLALPPIGPAGRFSALRGAPAHSLPKASPHSAEAWDFLSWWIANQTPELIVNPGNLPSRLVALNDWTAQQKRASATPAHIERLYEIATKYGKLQQVLPNNDAATAPFDQESALVLANKEDPKTAMAKACQEMMAQINLPPGA